MSVESRWRASRMWRAHLCLLPLTLCVSWSWVGCGDSSSERGSQTQRARLQETLDGSAAPTEAVATVDGRPISLQSLKAQVEALAGEQSRREVLDDLILAEALYDRALSEGYGDSPEVQLLLKRLMVQRLLEERVEKVASPESVPEQEVRTYYKENEVLYFNPELRGTFHMLVKPNSERWNTREDDVPARIFTMAREYAVKIREDIKAQGDDINAPADFEAVSKRWESKMPPELEILIESLPLFPKRSLGQPGQPGYLGTMVEPFADATFEMSKGQLSDVVETDFGVHIIKLMVIQPEERVSFEDAAPGIRDFLAKRKRRVLIRLLLNELMKDAQVGIDDSLLERL